MSEKKNNDKQVAMDVAEDSRQAEWHHPSFMAEIFKGNFRWNLLSEYPEQRAVDKKIGDDFIKKVKSVLEKHVNPDQIDTTGKYPKAALEALAKLGCFGMKISKEYGGLGFSSVNYTRVISFISTYCASTAVWLSAHQSIGVPQPLKLFGTEEQKKKYLPQFSKGKISAFALTEPEVGSDPARMKTTAKLSKDGKSYVIDGIKQWCTNGPDADIIIVMALTPPKMIGGREKKQITAFIVETKSPGFEVMHHCSFLGIRGISNGLLRFNKMRVPAENRLGGEGDGLKIAFVTLNAGRLAVPACGAAAGKWCLNVSRAWANERVQWGLPIGKHQAVADKIASMVANTFAMESISTLSAFLADNEKFDIRLEAASAKYFASEVSWKIADDTLQIRGGRGFETGISLKNRGEEYIPIERLLRDIRINRIIEGTSEIMQLFIAREAVDMHFKKAKPLLSKSPEYSLFDKIFCLVKMMFFYLWWYPQQWIYLPFLFFIRARGFDRKNRRHLHKLKRFTKRVARSIFHSMVRFGPALERQQLILAHHVDVGVEIFAMTSMLSRLGLELKKSSKQEERRHLLDLTDFYCRQASRRIHDSFRKIRSNDYVRMKKINQHFLDGNYRWLEDGIYKIYR